MWRAIGRALKWGVVLAAVRRLFWRQIERFRFGTGRFKFLQGLQ
jgi:hypothetical protein